MDDCTIATKIFFSGGPAEMGPVFAALAKAQGAFPEITKNRLVTIRPRNGSPYSFRFADLQEILTKTRKPLADNELALLVPMDTKPGCEEMDVILAHSSGHSITSRISIPPRQAFADEKEFGGHITYLRRYAVSALLNVAADDDSEDNMEAAGEGRRLDVRDEAREPAGNIASDPDLLAQAKEFASKGQEEYLAFFNAKSQEQRKTLMHGGFHRGIMESFRKVQA